MYDCRGFKALCLEEHFAPAPWALRHLQELREGPRYQAWLELHLSWTLSNLPPGSEQDSRGPILLFPESLWLVTQSWQEHGRFVQEWMGIKGVNNKHSDGCHWNSTYYMCFTLSPLRSISWGGYYNSPHFTNHLGSSASRDSLNESYYT